MHLYVLIGCKCGVQCARSDMRSWLLAVWEKQGVSSHWVPVWQHRWLWWC